MARSSSTQHSSPRRQGPLLDTTLAPTLVFTTDLAPPEARAAWRSAGVEVSVVNRSMTEEGGLEGESEKEGGGAGAGVGEEGAGGVCLEEVLAELAARGVIQVMVEGGGHLIGQVLASRSAQELQL